MVFAKITIVFQAIAPLRRSRSSFVILIQKIKSQAISLFIGVSAVFWATTSAAAERVTFNLAPLGEFQIKVADLEAFATTGTITPELNYYLRRLEPQQLNRLSALLTTPLELDPLAIAKFSNSQIGKIAIANFAKGIRGSYSQNGFYALRSAIIAAAFDDSQLTFLNLLRHYPLKTVHLDLEVLAQYYRRAGVIARNREEIERNWFPTLENRQITPDEDSQRHIERALGQYTWQVRTLSFQNPNRRQAGLFDLYQPNIERPVPLIAISHGIASNRQTFAYLAKHLASHGFAVAVIEHDAIALNKFDRFLSGKAPFPNGDNLINNPLDVIAVLDRLELEPNIDVERVGVVGQSFGGYTALALSGGELIANKTAAECQADSYPNVLLNLSSLAKCTFNQLDRDRLQVRDDRIKAVMAINPMIGIFGKRGMNSVATPTMIVSGTHDLVMPSVNEQIRPFSWLDEDLAKYLVLIKPGTHFSFLQEGLGVLPIPDTNVGPRPIHAYPALKALSTAFFQLHLAQKSEYRADLDSDRVRQLGNDAFELAIIRAIAESQLEKFE